MADFDGMISSQRAMIANLENEIGQLQEKITELESLTGQFAEFQNKVSGSASSTANRIGGWGSLIRSVVKTTFFSDLLQVVRGSEYSRAISSLDSAQNKIVQKIEEFQREIQEKQASINNCYNTISTLQTQKAEYERQQAEAAKQES